MIEYIEKSMTYKKYRSLMTSLLDENKTTGENQSEDFVNYTKLSHTRMTRLDKRAEISQENISRIKAIDRKMHWLILTEAWCGDAGQVIPYIEKMAMESDSISTSYVLRDENLDLMDQFLTNGGRSIPKMIILDKDSNEVLGSWGPRPSEVQIMVEERKKSENPMPYSEFSLIVQKWYNSDKGSSIQNELLETLESL